MYLGQPIEEASKTRAKPSIYRGKEKKERELQSKRQSQKNCLCNNVTWRQKKKAGFFWLCKGENKMSFAVKRPYNKA